MIQAPQTSIRLALCYRMTHTVDGDSDRGNAQTITLPMDYLGHAWRPIKRDQKTPEESSQVTERAPKATMERSEKIGDNRVEREISSIPRR